jgi:hypothetical protein
MLLCVVEGEIKERLWVEGEAIHLLVMEVSFHFRSSVVKKKKIDEKLGLGGGGGCQNMIY